VQYQSCNVEIHLSCPINIYLITGITVVICDIQPFLGRSVQKPVDGPESKCDLAREPLRKKKRLRSSSGGTYLVQRQVPIRISLKGLNSAAPDQGPLIALIVSDRCLGDAFC
jgi:hypothetical protein